MFTSKPILSFLLLSVLFTAGAANPLQLIQYQLDNGLTVYLNPDPTQNSVKGAVVVKGGSKRDTRDATGIAHYFEHIMFKGTTQIGTVDYAKEKPLLDSIALQYERLANTSDKETRRQIQLAINELSIKAAGYAIPNELNKILEGMGGTGINAYTTYDHILYYNEFPANQMEKWLEVYSHRFQEPVFRLFQSELETVYEEKNMYADNMFTKLLETLFADLLPGTTYGDQTILGSAEHLKNPSLKKMEEYYETYYVPNNMALVLSGNFDAETVKPLVEKKFGQMKRGTDPEPYTLNLQPMQGRKQVSHRLSPIRIGLLGFHTVPIHHPDRLALDVCEYMLSNYSDTGLLDEATNQQKVLSASSETLLNNSDLGAQLVIFVPKLLGQSFKNAEKVVWNALDRLKNGEFDDDLLEGTKRSLILQHYEELESGSSRMISMGRLFVNGMGWDDYLSVPDRLQSITKEDVMRVAQTYYGSDHLAFFSRTGFPKKDKVDKPPYKPISPSNTEAKSSFVQAIENTETLPVEPNFVIEGKDYKRVRVNERVDLFHVVNPINDVFSLELQFNTGLAQDLKFQSLDYLLEYTGTPDKSYADFQKELQKLGGSMSFNAGINQFVVNLKGPESAFPELLRMLNDRLTKPVLGEQELKALVSFRKSEKKMVKREPQQKHNALIDYVVVGSQSRYLNDPTARELKVFNTDSVLQRLQLLLDANAQLHYAGKRPVTEVCELVRTNLGVIDQVGEDDLRKARSFDLPQTTTVFFQHEAKAVQSIIHILVPATLNKQEDELAANIFSRYFSQGMSSVIFQEIREFRSLAYGAGGKYSLLPDRSKSGFYQGYMTTQADKTNEALETFTALLSNLPEKPERLEFIKANLQQSFNSERPEFRRLTTTIPEWEWAGFNEDPKKVFLESSDTITFELIKDFHNKYIANRPHIIIITGNRKKIDMEELEEKFGPVKELKFKQLYRF